MLWGGAYECCGAVPASILQFVILQQYKRHHLIFYTFLAGQMWSRASTARGAQRLASGIVALCERRADELVGVSRRRRRHSCTQGFGAGSGWYTITVLYSNAQSKTYRVFYDKSVVHCPRPLVFRRVVRMSRNIPGTSRCSRPYRQLSNYGAYYRVEVWLVVKLTSSFGFEHIACHFNYSTSIRATVII